MTGATPARAVAGASPWRRETDRILRLVERLAANSTGPVQAVVIEESPGYGAIRLLDMVRREMAVTFPSPVIRMPARHDLVTDWPSLVVEILAAAHEARISSGISRAELMDRRSALGQGLFRASIEDALRRLFAEHGRINLFVPSLDDLLEALGADEQWAFRNTMQSQPLAIVATARQGFRPNRDEAFYEYFRIVRVRGYVAGDLAALVDRFRLGSRAADMLAVLHGQVEGRPALIEAGLAAIASGEDLEPQDLLRLLATGGSALAEVLATIAAQPRQVLAALVRLEFPAGSGSLAEATGLSPSTVSAQIARLQKAGVLVADKDSGRNRLYRFADPVLGTLYEACVGTAR